MNRRTLISIALAASFALTLSLIVQSPVFAAAQPPQTVAVFLDIDGIAGASTDAQHKDAIEVQSFSLAGQNPGGDGKATLSEFFILKPLDAASPMLLKALATSQKIAKATVTVRGKTDAKGEARDYIRYSFTDLGVSRINQVVSGGGQEELNFRYASVKVEYMGADGKTVEAIIEGKK
jgi:type VI secretion system secreted protein Hcp